MSSSSSDVEREFDGLCCLVDSPSSLEGRDREIGNGIRMMMGCCREQKVRSRRMDSSFGASKLHSNVVSVLESSKALR